jgi:hypothetical protein
VERWFAAKPGLTFVGADQFIYFKQFEPTRRIAPDVYVLPGVRPGLKIDSWKTWERGVVPSLVFEIVSQDYLKDYVDGPAAYAEVGVRELIIFDPEYASDPSERLRFQVYRRLPKRGLVRVDATNEDRVRSKVLGVLGARSGGGCGVDAATAGGRAAGGGAGGYGSRGGGGAGGGRRSEAGGAASGDRAASRTTVSHAAVSRSWFAFASSTIRSATASA